MNKVCIKVEELRNRLDDAKFQLNDVEFYIQSLEDYLYVMNERYRRIFNLVGGMVGGKPVNHIMQEECYHIMQEIKDILEGKD